jgi:cell division protein DivIC
LKKVAWPRGGSFIWKTLPVKFSQLILGLYAALFVAVTLWAGSFFVQMHRDYTALKAQETANQRRLADAEARLQAQDKYLDQLRHDPALVERIIRQKLGYAKGEEFVFRFEEEKK